MTIPVTALKSQLPVLGREGELILGKSESPSELEESSIRLLWIRYEWLDGKRTLIDVIGQEIYCKVFDGVSQERWERFFRAWKSIVTEVMNAPLSKIDSFLPEDLLSRSVLSVVTLKRAETEEHFANALRKKGRLGKILEGH
jgi:hypothetical protein